MIPTPWHANSSVAWGCRSDPLRVARATLKGRPVSRFEPVPLSSRLLPLAWPRVALHTLRCQAEKRQKQRKEGRKEENDER